MEPRLDTPRLALTPISALDFDALCTHLIADDAVMRFYHRYLRMGSLDERRRAAQADFIEHFEQGRREAGLVVWTLRLRRDGAYVGWCGLSLPALPGHGPELGFMLAHAHQGSGLATEAAQAALADAWQRLRLPEVHAVVDRPNTASRRVLERCGFALDGAVTVYGSDDMLRYTRRRP
jgi:RimJ/RimL family protein N-acetyltransferase